MPETKKTSIESTQKLEEVKEDQFFMPTTGILLFLIVFFFILKKFIYIKDPKRDNK